ncbi:hypothetical protein QE152_g8401 [Popillia japonica]|uniref:Uncharacterized protein n=1 Tax=Popillia japonica TaxID=7064 RepID=A0AAW1MAQ8_POPJA
MMRRSSLPRTPPYNEREQKTGGRGLLRERYREPDCKETKNRSSNVGYAEKEVRLGSEMKEVRLVYMDRLNSKTNSLKKSVKENTKTKLAIKAMTKGTSKYTARATKYEKQAGTVDAQRGNILIAKQCSRVGVQVCENDILWETDKREEDLVKQIEAKLHEGGGWEGLSTILDLKWPNGCCKVTTEINQGAIREIRGDIVVIANPSAPFVGAASEDIKVGFPEVTTLMEESLEYVTTHTDTVLSSGRRGKKH